MISTYTIIGIIAGIFSTLAWFVYIFGILKKKTRPNRVTWSVLTLLGILVLFSYYDGGARDTVWVSIAYVIGPLIVALLAIFYYGEGGWTPFDRKCLLAISISFFVWLGLRIFVPYITLPILLVSLCIDFVGLLPTIKKSWEDPEFENPPAWFFESLSSILNIFAVSSWALSINSFSIWIYPVYLVFVNVLITLILFTSKIRKNKLKYGKKI